MKRFFLTGLATCAVLILGPDPSRAQSSGHGTHAHVAQAPGTGLSEPGQGAFAALAEVIAALRRDPDTQWDRVDIGALRDHLVDMDMLVTEAEVTQTGIVGGLEMRISTLGAGGAAAGRMVPAHAPVLAAETGWLSKVAAQGDAIVWRVTGDARQIRALGFFGLMALGDHHRAHHLALASGRPGH